MNRFCFDEIFFVDGVFAWVSQGMDPERGDSLANFIRGRGAIPEGAKAVCF